MRMLIRNCCNCNTKTSYFSFLWQMSKSVAAGGRVCTNCNNKYRFPTRFFIIAMAIVGYFLMQAVRNESVSLLVSLIILWAFIFIYTYIAFYLSTKH